MKNASKNRMLGYGYLILVFILWGSLYVVSKYVLGKMPTFTISFVRFTLAFLALSLVQMKGGRDRKEKIRRQEMPYILLIGVGGYFVAVGAQLLGTKYAGASTASLINSMNPITMLVFAALILHEPLTGRKLFGVLMAVAGVYAILGAGAGSVSIHGALLSLSAVILWSLVSVYTREATRRYEPLRITRLAVGIAAACYFPVSLYEIIRTGGIQADWTCILSLLYMGVVCTGAAYLLWNKSLSILEAGACSAFYPIQPLVSTILGMIFLGETVGWNFWMGTALITLGVVFSLKSQRLREAKQLPE